MMARPSTVIGLIPPPLRGDARVPDQKDDTEAEERVIGIAFYETELSDIGGRCVHTVVFLIGHDGERFSRTKTEFDGLARQHRPMTKAVMRWQALGVLPDHIERPAPSGTVLSLVEGGAA